MSAIMDCSPLLFMTKSPLHNPRRSLLFAGAALVASAQLATAQSVLLNAVADTTLRGGINETTNYGTSTVLEIFQLTTARNFFAYVRFDLSSIPSGANITSATLTFTYNGAGNGRTDVLNTGRFAAYGLLDVAGNTAQNWSETSLTYATRGAEIVAMSNTIVDITTPRVANFDGVGEFVAGGTGVGATVGLNTSIGLVDFLQDRFEASLPAATFIIDFPTAEASGRGYGLGSREAASGFPTLSIEYAVIPEPGAVAALAGVAALGVAVIRRRRS
jgi:hypothetical protein